MKAKLVVLVVCSLLFSLFLPETSAAAASQMVTKGNTSEKVVALTFDDGADGTNIPSILDTLKRENVPATFFLTGTGLKDHPDRIRQITADGHELGNHSYTHPDFTTLSRAQIIEELEKTEALTREVTGQSTKPIFRAPFGYVNAAVLDGVGAAGYTHTIGWNIDTIDWRGPYKNEITDRVISGIEPGSIVLMHTGAGAPGTPHALPDIIQELDALGYRFVTVGDMLGLSEPVTGQTYIVQPGDTLTAIAARFNTTAANLREWNNLQPGAILSVGQVLIVSDLLFSDIAGNWARSEIQTMAEQQYVFGRSPGLFVPGGDVTRAEFAALLTRVLELDTNLDGPPFADINTADWYAPYAAAVKNAGMMTGYPAGGSTVFRPDQKISREEVAVVLVRALEAETGSTLPSQPLTFADRGTIADWAESSVARVTEAGLMRGRTSTTFDPKGVTTRAESAVVMYRLLPLID
ncbi:polysaccharide deacetylase family protein [Alkalicoccus chagannorensis]|uniref:polysaccharide deacetylase family protein n=1 Tax=Alkalicoccus chagannorensis TaxID=427072 RepID=UPI0004075BB1|nr:polysaccharide deacetylase family protein [Alkalicoccus chagannorensis]